MKLVLAAVDPPVRRALDRYGITELVGADAVYATPGAAVEAYGTASRIS